LDCVTVATGKIEVKTRVVATSPVFKEPGNEREVSCMGVDVAVGLDDVNREGSRPEGVEVEGGMPLSFISFRGRKGYKMS